MHPEGGNYQRHVFLVLKNGESGEGGGHEELTSDL